jgi:transposase-like protein
MWKQLRSTLSENEGVIFTGKIEIDETYAGGHRVGKRGRGAKDKGIVLGIVQRKGKIKGTVIPNVKAKTLMPVIKANVMKDDTTVYTDDLNSYKRLDRLGFDHKVIEHTRKVYVMAGDIHTNSIEGFWSQLKRSIDGTYHHVTPEHLQEYVDEYSFRYNHRNDERPMFLTMLEKVSSPVS